MELQNESNEPKSRANLSFFFQISGQDNEIDPVALDHCYSKPWNGHPDSLRARPAKMLFMKGIPFHPGLDGPNHNTPVDVVAACGKPLPPYDSIRAQSAMNESEVYASILNTNSAKDSDDWEEILRNMSFIWTSAQTSLFNKLLKIIQAEHMARLAYEGTQNEPVMRRLAADKSAARTRHLFGSIGWDMKQLQWLHHILLDNVDRAHLVVYLDILQSLKAKVPNLIDKLLMATKTVDSLQNNLKRPWDPVITLFAQQKLKKLPGTPIFILSPGDPPLGGIGHLRRHKFWHSQLSALGKVVTLSLHISQNMSVKDSIETVMITLKNKISELKKTFPFRPIILIGWAVGAVIACQVALIEGVSATVCLGFPLTGVLGSRGDLDDPLLESRTPTLFVVGQNACTCSVDDVEDFRERMRAESGLVVIGGGDDHLRINRLKRKLEGVTQAMVDRCILDEIAAFLSCVLTQPFEDSPQFYTNLDKTKKETKAKRKTKSKGYMMKDVKASKRQYNRKQPTKAMTNSVERFSPSSPGSSTTDTSSTCSAGDNLCKNLMANFQDDRCCSLPSRPTGSSPRLRGNMGRISTQAWKKPKRGVGRPPLYEQIPKKKRMKLHFGTNATGINTPSKRLPGSLPKRQSRLPGIFSNYLMEPQYLPANTSTTSSLVPLQCSPLNSSVKPVPPPTIPSAASTPNLGSFEAPRGFIARMDSPQTSTASLLTSSPRMMVSNIKTKQKNVTFVTSPTTTISGGATFSVTPSLSSSIASASLEITNLESKPSVASRQILVQKKLSDITHIRTLLQKKTSNITKVVQPVQLLSSGNKPQSKIDNLTVLMGNAQPMPCTSLLQSALSMNKSSVSPSPTIPSPIQAIPSTSSLTCSQVPTSHRKMQVITFLKPPPNSVVSKPIVVSSSEKETEQDFIKTSDSLQPKVIRTYGDIKLNRQLAALKQQHQLSEDVLPEAFNHLSMGTQDAVYALTQLSALPQDI